jgi:hypothetical protein
MKPAKFKSGFAILDVMTGRRELERRVNCRGGSVRIRVDMTIDRVHGNDDGVSQEFSCTVLSVKEFAK